jgi:hypothetical protein
MQLQSRTMLDVVHMLQVEFKQDTLAMLSRLQKGLHQLDQAMLRSLQWLYSDKSSFLSSASTLLLYCAATLCDWQ